MVLMRTPGTLESADVSGDGVRGCGEGEGSGHDRHQDGRGLGLLAGTGDDVGRDYAACIDAQARLLKS